jgi:hypothetical protein
MGMAPIHPESDGACPRSLRFGQEAKPTEMTGGVAFAQNGSMTGSVPGQYGAGLESKIATMGAQTG